MTLRNILGLLTVALMAFILITPQLAEARAGGGMSGGSRGSRSYSSPSSTNPYNYNNPAYQPQGSPFMRGMLGGLLGAGLFSMLFGSWGGGTGIGLLPIIVLVAFVYMIRRQYANRYGARLGIPNVPYGTNAPPNAQAITITDADKEAFGRMHFEIQSAWSEGDMNRLGQHLTPEMTHYFSEELAANASHGIVNKIEQVRLQHANILEAWHEFDTDYATARLEWSAIDYNARIHHEPHDPDYIASGSRLIPETVAEVWTFARTNGGRWLLSAIQQVS